MSFKSETDTIIALVGLAIFLAGLYLWLGLAAPLIILGLIMMYAGVRLDPAILWSKQHEFNQNPDTRQS